MCEHVHATSAVHMYMSGVYCTYINSALPESLLQENWLQQGVQLLTNILQQHWIPKLQRLG